MKIKRVFVNNLPIYLTDNWNNNNPTNFFRSDEIDFTELVTQFFKGELTEAYVYSENIKELRKKFKASFKVVKAAGGLVKNTAGEVLFIYRNGVWDLPKGKIEKGEGKKTAAVREVEEETGVQHLVLGERLETTYHIFRRKGKTILKVTYWFAMTTTATERLLPQEEEGITEVRWVAPLEVEKLLPTSYANIQLLFSNLL